MSALHRPGWYSGSPLVDAVLRYKVSYFDTPLALVVHRQGVVENGILPYVAEELARLDLVEGYVTGEGRLKKLRLCAGRTMLSLRRVLLKYQAKRIETCEGSITVTRVRNRGIHYYHNHRAKAWNNPRWGDVA